MYSHILEEGDELVYDALIQENSRQSKGLELIPSENYVSPAVLEALGSTMTNKYSEGLPGKRYYGGQKYTDRVETLAIERICKLFRCKYANVQPLSGSPANLAAYFGMMQPGDTILGMDLSHGGHLTHGHPMTVGAKIFKFVSYGMSNLETGEIDYELLRTIALKEKPKVILAGFSAYPRNLDWAKFKEIADEVGAYTMADVAHIAGMIAANVLENPFDHGFDVVTTTTHKTLRGPRGGVIMVRENEELMNKINKFVFPGLQGGPHMNNIAAKAVAFYEAMQPDYVQYCQQILKNAKAFENTFKKYNVKMITGGTDNHLLLIDVFSTYGISGKEAEIKLDSVGITLNKNVIPNDPRSPMDPSGIRLGTPAITTRGMTEINCSVIGEIIHWTLSTDSYENTARTLIHSISSKFQSPSLL